MKNEPPATSRTARTSTAGGSALLTKP